MFYSKVSLAYARSRTLRFYFCNCKEKLIQQATVIDRCILHKGIKKKRQV